MALSSPSYMEINNGRIALDTRTGIVTYISRMGTIFTGARRMTPAEIESLV